jgi:hypothetical protein
MFNAAGKNNHILGLTLLVVFLGLIFCFDLPSFGYAQDATYPSPETTPTYSTSSNSSQISSPYPPPMSNEKSSLTQNSEALLLELSNPIYIPVVQNSPCFNLSGGGNFQAGGYTMPEQF